MQLHQLTQSTGIKKDRRIGRGGKRGKTSGKGHKGQKARAGKKIRPAERDIIKRIPKLRGHGKNRARTVNASKVRPLVINLRNIEVAFMDGERVSPKTLIEKKVLKSILGKLPHVKILGCGTLSKKVTVADCEMSQKAKELIEKIGGVVL